MKLGQNYIGAEILSILTKGMYADPKDALREYVQNGVDANSGEIKIKVRQTSIVVQDYGDGMDKTVMKKAIRLGISDKNPKRSVGFMGIGLYSSFHLCDRLTIYSKVKDQPPNKLEFKFREMRVVLDEQKNARIEKEDEQGNQIALLKLLQDYIDLTEIEEGEFPSNGTRVELSGLESYFFESLSKFDEVSEYLEKTIPLPFSPEFKFGSTIQDYISKKCEEHNATFKTVTLELQINDDKRYLFKPYKDSDFKPGPLEPEYVELKSPDGYFGVAWGCLNGANEVIKNEKVRGFLIKKHGFTIGTRNNLLSTFGAKFFNRYVGEFIIVHPKILPNGARSDFEYSSLRSILYAVIQDAAETFNDSANKHQEREKAELELDKLLELYRQKKTELLAISENTDKLLETYTLLHKAYVSFKKRAKTTWKIKDDRKKDADEALKLAAELIGEVRSLMEQKAKPKKTRNQITEDLEKAPIPEDYKEPNVRSLAETIELIGIPFNEELKEIFNLLDEQFIKPQSKDEADYSKILLKLKSDIEDLFNETEEEG